LATSKARTKASNVLGKTSQLERRLLKFLLTNLRFDFIMSELQSALLLRKQLAGNSGVLGTGYIR
jgi:hypothetical protein